jgi:sialate O-acetylesterase
MNSHRSLKTLFQAFSSIVFSQNTPFQVTQFGAVGPRSYSGVLVSVSSSSIKKERASMLVMNVLLLAFLILITTPHLLSQERPFRLAPLFTDNVVLQQNSEVPIWGKGIAGARITVNCSWGISASTRVGTDGMWLVRTSTPAAGGPYDVTVNHDDTTCILRNVLIGEVWLCSGQSNMEMPLQGWPPGDTIANWAAEIKKSAYSSIRLFTVRRTFSAAPEFACEGSWSECSPFTSPAFSATAYFFGRMLYDSLHIPIGLIHSSWGGTAVESWMSAEYLSRFHQYDTTLRKIDDSQASVKLLQDWLARFPVIDMKSRNGPDRWRGLTFQDERCAALAFNDSAWHVMALPVVWERSELGEFDGVVWFRRRIEIPRSWLHRDLTLELGPIDDMDITYVNGTNIGSQEGEGFWKIGRVYRVPKALVDTTVIQIAVRVVDTQGGGGIFGEPSAMAIHPEGDNVRIALAGIWKYLPLAELRGDRFYVMGPAEEIFWTRPRLPINVSAYTPTALYNGMIAPLVPMTFRGAIWYQGESNVDNAGMYRDLFPLMIKNWRSAFQVPDLPFYYVQIAPYEYEHPVQSQYLREAQFLTLSLENTGMAVTMDIGNPKNIHPANKQDVGKRLALWALAKTYKRTIPFTGPLYHSMNREKNRIVLSFEHADRGLLLRDRPGGNRFQIAGEDSVFRDAKVVVRGGKLVVWNPEIRKPLAVRYAFTNAPAPTLFNMEGLPSPSFRTDDWEH